MSRESFTSGEQILVGTVASVVIFLVLVLSRWGCSS